MNIRRLIQNCRQGTPPLRADLRISTLKVFALALLLLITQWGVAEPHQQDELIKYDAGAGDKAQKIYERKHQELIPQTDVSTQTQASNLTKLQNGEITVEAYLNLRAQYETDVSNLDPRKPLEVIRKKIHIPLEDTYTKRIDFSPPLYKQRRVKGACCDWYEHKRTQVITYSAMLDADQYDYDFVIFVIDTNGLNKYAYEQLKKILQFIEGGKLLDQAKGIGKAIIKGIDVGREIQEGNIGKATKKTAATTAIKTLKDQLKKMKGGKDKLVGPLQSLYKDIKQLKQQGEGVINAFQGKEGMVSGKAVYLGNFIYGMRLKGSRLLPDDVWWKASDSTIETNQEGTFYAKLPCGLSQKSVGQIGGGNSYFSHVDFCGKKKAVTAESHKKASKKKKEKKGTVSGSGIEPHKVRVPRIVTKSGQAFLMKITFKDKCQQKAYEAAKAICRQYDTLSDALRGGIRDATKMLNQELNADNSAKMDYEHSLRRYNGTKSRTVKHLEKKMLDVKINWQAQFAEIDLMKEQLKGTEAKFRACIISAVKKGGRTPPCPKINEGGKPDDVVKDITVGGGSEHQQKPEQSVSTLPGQREAGNCDYLKPAQGVIPPNAQKTGLAGLPESFPLPPLTDKTVPWTFSVPGGNVYDIGVSANFSPAVDFLRKELPARGWKIDENARPSTPARTDAVHIFFYNHDYCGWVTISSKGSPSPTVMFVGMKKRARGMR